MFTVTGTNVTVTDAAGMPLCHSPRQDKRSSNAARRRQVVANWEDAMSRAGVMVGTRVLCVDMVWRERGAGVEHRDGLVDFGHVVADSLDGAYCGCNALPVEGAANRADGDCRPTVDPAWPMDAFRAAFRAVALQNMTGTKARRAV